MRNLAHFRRPLFQGLRGDGYALVAVAPDDLRDGEEKPAPHHDIPVDRGGTNPLIDIATLLAYVGLFRRLQPQAVLGYTPKANIYAGLAARLWRVPFIPNISGLGTGYLRGGVVRKISLALYRMAFAKAPTVFFQNPDDREEFLGARIVRPEQAALLPGSGVDLQYFSVCQQPNSKVLRLLFVGRLLADKGLKELVEAVAMVKAGGKKVELTLVGAADPGNPTSIAGDELLAWRDSDHVNLAGEQGDVRPFIADADAVVLPSYREGLPRVLLEAAAMGRPMIATDVPGCREIVKEGQTGILCAPADPVALAHAIERFISLGHPERAMLGQAARRLVEDQFDQERVVDRYRDALARIGVRSVDGER